jgi:SAM-dependent methyltransferase
MALYRALKHAYLTLVPERLRMMSHDKRTPLYYLLKPMRNTLYQFSDHDDVYDEHYYQDNIEPYIQQSASIMAESITRTFHPSFVVDVGCGTGELLRVLKEHNVAVQGFERSEAALKIARGKGVEVKPLDLEQPLDRLEIRRADLVISTEVAEHLPKSFADIFVDYLCRTADSVLMTAATPGPITSTNNLMSIGSRNSEIAASPTILRRLRSCASHGSRPTSPPSIMRI